MAAHMGMQTASALSTQTQKTLYSPDSLATVSFLGRRADGRPLDWRAGLPPKADELDLELELKWLGLPHDHAQQPLPSARGRSRASRTARTARDSPESIRYEMHDFVKATVWANHDMLHLRPSSMGCSCRGPATATATTTAKGVFVDGHADWLQHTRGEHLHIHDDAEGTVHMMLSAADAWTAMEHGWARADTLPGAYGVHGVQYVTVFAPRCAAEMDDWKRLVLASVRVCAAACQGAAVRRPERL